ncbi:MAG: four helix bundle protein [Crocosphaera sp.]
MSYREQFIWKRGIQLSINCYKLTEKFPKTELYGLTSQIRRASVSVPSNIAEGVRLVGYKPDQSRAWGINRKVK